MAIEMARLLCLKAADAMDRLIAWLERAMLEDDGAVAIVHGDYRVENVIFESAAPRIAGVIDWELSTLGHPFADLAYQCMRWRLPRDSEFHSLGVSHWLC